MDAFIIVTPGFPADENDTTCLPPVQQFMLSLKKLYPQFQLVVLTFQYPFEKKEYQWHGVRVISIGGKNRPKLFRLITWIRAYRVLKELRKENKIRGKVRLWLTECSLVGKFFCYRFKLPHYMWIQGQDAKKENQYIKRIRPKGSEVIAISDFTKSEFYKNHGQMPFLVAENGIAPASFPALNTSLRKIDVLGVGSLIPLKNYPLFFEIVSEIKKTYPHIHVVIAGQGPEELTLKELLKKANLESHVHLLGSVPHPEVLDLMANSKVFLHTSVYEGNSTVLMEALYSGCKVYSTRPLADRKIKNLNVLSSKNDLIKGVLGALRSKSVPERVLFNSMDDTARKIMNLFN